MRRCLNHPKVNKRGDDKGDNALAVRNRLGRRVHGKRGHRRGWQGGVDDLGMGLEGASAVGVSTGGVSTGGVRAGALDAGADGLCLGCVGLGGMVGRKRRCGRHR